MNEIITTAAPDSLPWWILVFAVIPVVLGLTATIIDRDDGGFLGLGVLVAIVYGVIVATILGSTHGNMLKEIRTEGLNEAGYVQVELNGTDFDAVKDGERVKGTLVPFPEDSNMYQIVIIPTEVQ